ncbi:radical SAM protein [Vibrio fluvialis]
MDAYIQITTACNMSCAHCCFACSAEKKGESMSPKTYKKAVALAEDYGMNIMIGGGEPTIHARFWEYFGIAMGAQVDHVWMATNGSKTETSLALAAISTSEKFSCALSVDDYHDPIDPIVYRTFKEVGAEIRGGSEVVLNVGSAKENNIGNREGCGCSHIAFIHPSGDVRACACPDARSLGHIDDDDIGEKIERIRELENNDLESCHVLIDPTAEEFLFEGEMNIEDVLEEIEGDDLCQAA